MLVSLYVVSAVEVVKALEKRFNRKKTNIIYRSGSGKGTNLTLSKIPIVYPIQHSFFQKAHTQQSQWKPINETGELIAVKDGRTDVYVKRVKSSKMSEWMNTRENANNKSHKYINILKGLPVKVK